MNYYERYCGDYARDTGHLTLGQHGAYTLLLDTQYATERGLPVAYDDLYRICRAMNKGEQSDVRAVANAFFLVGPDGLRWNTRAARDIASAQTRISAARANGKHGGRPPKDPNGNPPGSKQEPNGNPVGFQNGTQDEPRTNPRETHAGVRHTPDTITSKPYIDVNSTQQRARDQGVGIRKSKGRKPNAIDAIINGAREQRHEHERAAAGKPIIEGVAARVDSPPVRALPGDVGDSS